MQIWPFPMFRNYRTSAGLTDLFLRFASDPELRVVDAGQYEIKLACSHGELTFWNANKYYAWGQSGFYKRADGTVTRWQRELPSRHAVREMVKATDAARFKS